MNKELELEAEKYLTTKYQKGTYLGKLFIAGYAAMHSLIEIIIYYLIVKIVSKYSFTLPVECSAYYVHITGQGETCVVAENIADAMDKIEKLTEANYTFIF